MPRDVSDLVAEPRAGGGDRTDVEVKSAAGGLPTSLNATLSAMANLPGGGLVILGLDKRAPRRLRDLGLVTQVGGRGQTTTYHRTDE